MKQLLFGVFENAQSNDSGTATWRHPDNERIYFDSLEYWVNIAKICETGGIDWLFLADAWGWSEIDDVRPAICDVEALDLPRLDPSIVIAALLQSTKRLGLVITGSTLVEAPYSFVRRMATLDHLSKGRIGWNIVTTGTADTAADAFGQARVEHDERYKMAEDFIELSYKLFEGAWQPDAVERDRLGRYSDPEKVHRVFHEGPFFKCDGYGNSHYSPQGTPVLFQAGSSPRGLQFAGKHGECIFVSGDDTSIVAEQTRKIRAEAVLNGRDPYKDIKVICAFSCVVGDTKHQAYEKHQEILKHQNLDVAAASYAMFTGLDLSKYEPETKIKDLKTELSKTQILRFGDASVGEVLGNWHANGVRPEPFIGTPEQISDAMSYMAKAADLDGFMFTPMSQPSSTIDFVSKVLPIMRGNQVNTPNSKIQLLRQKLMGSLLPYLAESHPGASYRHVKSKNLK